jgi:hypothetical protein
MNANPSSTLSNGFKNIEFSGGQTSEFLPPNFDSAEGKRIASNAIATQKQALLNYSQTPDAKGNYPSGADITKKANELSDGVKILLGRSFLQEAQSQKNTAELLVPELKGVDLNNNAAIEKAIQQATKNNRKSNDINAAQSAIKKYKDEHSHEWVDILGQGSYIIQEDNSEWDEKADASDLFENED